MDAVSAKFGFLFLLGFYLASPTASGQAPSYWQPDRLGQAEVALNPGALTSHLEIGDQVEVESPEAGEDSDRAPWISLTPVYYGEVFTKPRGGRSPASATRYQGLLDIGIAIDFDQAGSRIPGQFFILAQNTHGRGLTEDFIGDTQVISNIDSFDNIMQVSEYWWEFNLLDDRMTVRLGKQDLNQEFLFINTAEHFIQSTFGLSPSTAFPTFPDQAMGAVALTQLNRNWQLKTGIWNAFARGGSFGFAGDDTVLVVGELEKTYALASGRLPGTFAIGAVYESAGVVDGERLSPVHEYIFQIEQAIYRETGSEEFQGLSVFAGYYPRFVGDTMVDGTIGTSFVMGITYAGIFSDRPDSIVGLGIASAELFQGGTHRETVTELFFRSRITKQVSLQPDLQYISSPSGIYPDAIAAGMRFQVDF